MTLYQLSERCGYWMARLNLPHWHVKVQWETAAALKRQLGFDALGCVTWDTENEYAVISISRSCEKAEREPTLVHEILHIVWDGHREVQPHDLDKERAINRITAALLKEERA